MYLHERSTLVALVATLAVEGHRRRRTRRARGQDEVLGVGASSHLLLLMQGGDPPLRGVLGVSITDASIAAARRGSSYVASR